MHALRIAIAVAWIPFWIGWIGSAFTAKKSVRGNRRRFRLIGVTGLAVALVSRVMRNSGGQVNALALGIVGAVLFVAGIGLAIWARVYLGRNWGMPMTERAEPELVTSGPYRFVRHPIYTGLLLGLLGTALATDLLALLVVLVLGAYFYYSASVEEKNLTATFPTDYPAYRAHTKMLIPFVL